MHPSKPGFHRLKKYFAIIMLLDLVRYWWSNYTNTWALIGVILFAFCLMGMKVYEYIWIMDERDKERIRNG